MLPIFSRRFIGLAICCCVACHGRFSGAQESNVEKFVAELQNLRNEGDGNVPVIGALPNIENATTRDGLELLVAMRDDQPLQANWLRLVAESVFQKAPPELSSLRTIVLDNDKSDFARVAAFQMLEDADQTQAAALVPAFQTDTCLPLRRIAIEQKMQAIDELNVSNEQKEDQLRLLLDDIRDIDQIDAVIKRLKDSTKPVDRNQWLGFVLDWHVIGPFDNTDGKGFAAVYPIENQIATPQFNKKWPGKEAEVSWSDIASKDENGFVDINQLLAKHNGAVVYLAANIKSPTEQDAQVRAGTYNAIKVWFNGREVIEREVYHSNEMVDQFVADVHLNAGDNWVVIKLCQNEQPQAWAQNWRFLFRVTDKSGKSINH